jgi:hypothetical protein
MESNDQYNFSLFLPRNKHGRKNRNVILTMLLIWAVAVFGFQFLLRILEKPVPEESLNKFETLWPMAVSGNISDVDLTTLLGSLLHVRGKNTVKPDEQKVVSSAINTGLYRLIPDSLKQIVAANAGSVAGLRQKLATTKGEEYLKIRAQINETTGITGTLVLPYSGFTEGSLEAQLLVSNISADYPETYSDPVYKALPGIMKLYLTHNRSVLTDSIFLGFPFHYFYTAVFLLILFVGLCILYNILVEWRLKKEGVVE